MNSTPARALIVVLTVSQMAFAADGNDAFQFFQEEAKVAIATQREQTPGEKRLRSYRSSRKPTFNFMALGISPTF